MGNKTITPEAKQKIFSLYAPLRIVGNDSWPSYGKMDYLLTCNPEYAEKGNYLWVKPLSSISDKDATEIANIASLWENDELFAEDVGEWLNEILTGNCATYANYVSGYQMIEIIDFLREKGYALPACGFSVDYLITAKVFQLTN